MVAWSQDGGGVARGIRGASALVHIVQCTHTFEFSMLQAHIFYDCQHSLSCSQRRNVTTPNSRRGEFRAG